jgi:hypothetical protein
LDTQVAPSTHAQRLENMATLFEVWGQMNVNLRAKAPGPLVDGDEAMTLALLWALIEWYEFDEQVSHRPNHLLARCLRHCISLTVCRDSPCRF